MAEERSTRRERDKNKEDRKICRECGKRFKTRKGMMIHNGRMFKKDREESDNYSKCGEEFWDKATKTNHERESVKEGKEDDVLYATNSGVLVIRQDKICQDTQEDVRKSMA